MENQEHGEAWHPDPDGLANLEKDLDDISESLGEIPEGEQKENFRNRFYGYRENLAKVRDSSMSQEEGEPVFTQLEKDIPALYGEIGIVLEGK